LNKLASLLLSAQGDDKYQFVLKRFETLFWQILFQQVIMLFCVPA
jgi:hypothetical protein